MIDTWRIICFFGTLIVGIIIGFVATCCIVVNSLQDAYDDGYKKGLERGRSESIDK